MSLNTVKALNTYVQDAEQDEDGTGELPTYNQVMLESPNSRFGRWRGWIEKRAAERYADLSPEELQRRRTRGLEEDSDQQPGSSGNPALGPSLNPDQADVCPILQVNDDLLSASVQLETRGEQASFTVQDTFHTSTDPFLHSQKWRTTVREALVPTHLQVHQFGSRFLPHTRSPMRCVLPLQRDRMLLIGTDSGLSVMDMYPVQRQSGDDNSVGIIQKGPNEALARVVWTGEAVYQLSILEYEDIGEGTPQGVVLALVGPDPEAPSASTGHQQPLRSLRMYNLTSLITLAKWILTQHDSNPVDLRRASDWNIQQTPPKKHRSASSITKGLRNLIIDSPPRPQQTATSYESYLSVPSTKRVATTAATDSSWDVVDDLPLRWATDFVPLATSASRLASASVIAYALWQDGGPGPGGGRHGRRALLAVATKANIFLYETPKGERAFHFVKDFYTPFPPRGLSFCHQSVQDTPRPPLDAGPIRLGGGVSHTRAASSDSSSSSHHHRQSKILPAGTTYSAQMAIFVIFEKKASIIRIADSAVTEVDLYDANGCGMHGAKDHPLAVRNAPSARRSRTSVDFSSFREGKGPWILPCLVDLPRVRVPSGGVSSVYVLTRGKHSHIVPAPLPAAIQATPPFCTVTWMALPLSVSCRVCLSPPHRFRNPAGTAPFVQLVGLGEDGVEVHEVPLAALSSQKGKDRDGVVPFEATHARSIIGETGFLAHGGNWHQFGSLTAPPLTRTVSGTSTSSCDSIESEEMLSRLRAAAGIYCSLHKDVEDWRVFWVGGDTEDVGEHEEDEDGVLV